MSTPFYLAVDIRTDTTTAAVAVGSDGDAIRVSGLTLGIGSTMPTAVYVGAEELYFGESAVERGVDDPERLIRDFLPGEGALDTPIVVAGEDFSRADLYAWTVDAVARRVAGERGAAPSGIWLVVPAVWSDAHLQVIADAFDRDGQAVDFIAAPEALAARYSQLDPADADLTLVICDLDERTLATSIERASPRRGSRPLAAPILASVLHDGVGKADLDQRAIDSIARGLQDAGVELGEVDAIVLSGVSERVGEFESLLADTFGDPIATDPHPALASSLGAALLLAREAGVLRAGAAPIPAVPLATVALSAPAAIGVTHSAQSAGTGIASKWYRRPVGVVALGVGVLLAGAATVGGAYAIGGIGSSVEDARVTPGTTEVQVANDPADSPAPATSPTTAPVPAPVPEPVPPTASEPEDDSSAPANPRVPNAAAPRAPGTPGPVADPAPAPAEPAPPVVTPEPTPDPVPTTTPEPEPEPTEEPTPTPEPTPSESSSPTPPPTETDLP
ncbi:MAG TPA: hypothetical protein VEX12_02405 [Microbacterium sp.]|nr:hypothetical protein [Microbacterium sp.]